ncbi:MAG TPA: nucleoside-triphosphatase [Ferruginibacter sp.]|nr:nucleoside-triphosphatase [Ferruginibacter sp.]
MSIILFSRPVHSGKTTELLHWCNRQKNIEGILMPDMNGSRKILNLKTEEVFDIECTSVETSLEPLTSVGKFHFYTSAFEKANTMLIGTLEHDPRWLVIDEAGKLELEGKGFYPAIAKAVSVYDNEAKTGNLLVTVRESLCSNVIAFFGINRCRIIHRLEELTG